MQKKIFLYTILLAVSLTLAAGSYGAVLLDRVVATVNDEVITWSELMSVISIEGRAFLKDVPENQKKARMKEMERPFLKNMVEMKLQLQEAKKMGISIDDTEIDSAISEIKKKYNMTDEILKRSLDAEGITMEDYRKRLSEQIIVTKVINSAIKSNIVITDSEVEEYYEANSERYSGDEKVKIRQILFTIPEEGMREALEQRAKDITGRIKKGEEFSRLAVEFSDGPSREFGGDLGYIGRGSALKEIEDVAFALEIGEVSEPFWSAAGLHIIMIEDRIERGIEKVRDKIQETLFQDSFKMKFHEWSTGLREKASVEIKL